MPIYEYDCSNCNETLEAIQKVKEKPLTECPRCGEPALIRRTSLTSFQLKGGGWYRDGYSGGNINRSADSPPISSNTQAGTESPAA